MLTQSVKQGPFWIVTVPLLLCEITVKGPLLILSTFLNVFFGTFSSSLSPQGCWATATVTKKEAQKMMGNNRNCSQLAGVSFCAETPSTHASKTPPWFSKSWRLLLFQTADAHSGSSDSKSNWSHRESLNDTNWRDSSTTASFVPKSRRPGVVQKKLATNLGFLVWATVNMRVKNWFVTFHRGMRIPLTNC